MTQTTVVSNPPNSFVASIIRTLVPIIVGYVATILLKLGVDFHGDITPLVTAALTAGYYVGVRVLEHFKSSKFGWLLGKPSAPIYPTGTQTTITNTEGN